MCDIAFTMNGRRRRPSKLRAVSVGQVDERAARRQSEVRSINLEHPSVGELYWQHLAMTDLPWRNFLSPDSGTKSQSKVPYFGVTRLSLKHIVG